MNQDVFVTLNNIEDNLRNAKHYLRLRGTQEDDGTFAEKAASLLNNVSKQSADLIRVH